MTGIGKLAGEQPEPMDREHFIALQKRVRASWNGDVVIDKRDVERMLDEIQWLKRRLRRIENAIEPIAEALREGQQC